jgi:hypothetical protein
MERNSDGITLLTGRAVRFGSGTIWERIPRSRHQRSGGRARHARQKGGSTAMSYDTDMELVDHHVDALDAEDVADIGEDAVDEIVALKIKRSD